MPAFTGTANYAPGNTLNLGASLQADALGGMGAGDDMSGLIEQLMARRAKLDRAAKTVRAPKQSMTGDMSKMPYGPQSGFLEGQRYQNFRNLLNRDRTVNQLTSSAIGGHASQAFGDSARQAQALMMAGMPIYDYSGMRDIVQGNAAASGNAVEQAGKNARMRQAGGNAALLKAIETERG